MTLRAVILAGIAALLVAPIPAKPAAAPTRGLLLADIHFDPFATMSRSQIEGLRLKPIEEWDGIFGPPKGVPSSYDHDSNYSLMCSALSAAAGQNTFYVVCTGDLLAHGFRDLYYDNYKTYDGFSEFTIKTERYVLAKMQKTLGVPVICALGNNDTDTGDYSEPSPQMLEAVAAQLKTLSTPESRATFAFGGFCLIPNPAVPGRDVLVLNSVLWSASAPALTLNQSDPGWTELDWLQWQLDAARRAGRKATLVMHIPPGFDAYKSVKQGAPVAGWRDEYTNRFRSIMKTYGDVVQIGFAGHTHMDDFRLISGTLPIRITPAVSPLFFNNPGYATFDFDQKSGEVGKIETFYLQLSPLGTWSNASSFSPTLNGSPFVPAVLSKLASGILTSLSTREKFGSDYNDRGTDPKGKSPFFKTEWPYYACAQTNFTDSDYWVCVMNASGQK